MLVLLLALGCGSRVDTGADTGPTDDTGADTGPTDDTDADTGVDSGDPVDPSPYADCVAVKWVDSDADGVAEVQSTSWFDAWGHEVRIERDDGVDGSVDAVDVHTWEGELWTGSTWDWDGDGTLDLSYRREHDAEDRLILEATDYGADGDDDNLSDYAWDGSLEVRKRTDFNGDGRWEMVETKDYTDGLLTTWTSDLGDDGVVDQIRTWAYDAGGHVLVDELDADADGVVDQRYTYTWDGDLLVDEGYDTDADGVIDRSLHNSYDAEGHLIRTELDRDGDGVVDEIAIKEWDGDEMIAQRVDQGADGSWDHIVEQDFEEGQLVELREDVDGDGVWDTVERYAWDEEGRPLLEEMDYGADGVVDTRTTWTWEC